MDDPLNSVRGRMLQDRGAGTAKSLAEYAQLFAGEDPFVARAYADVFGASPTSPAPSDQDSIGHYRIVKELGRGGQGIVYLAEDTRLHRKVALKVLTGLGPGSEDSVHRLRREAEVASKLEHPGICGVHDAGVANGTPYIAMHYVEGTTLADRISATKSQPTAGEPTTKKQEIPEILRVFEKAAAALHAAHEAGIVHRDIKPGNVMVAASGQPVILDFGLARAEDMELQTLTRTGDVFGTPAYMSPEQISGQRIRLDRRSDVYSLGVTLYECLTLRRPFEAPTREGVYQAVMTKSPPDPRKINRAISKDLKVVIETALEKDRDRRYATADAMAKDLEAVLEGRPIQARPVGPVGRFVRWSKREPAKAALLGVLLVALPVIATLVTSHLKDQPQVEAARLAKVEQDKDEILSDASFELSEGDPKRAAELYTRVLEMEGRSPEAAGGLVLTHLKLKNASTALELLEKHRALLGDGAAAHVLRADALTDLGREGEAKALLATAPPPQSAFEHHLLAQKELQKGEDGDTPAYRRALGHVTTAILLSPAPRLSLYTLRAHAAGHVKDRDAVVETSAALRQKWGRSESALRWCSYALSQLGDQGLLDDAIALAREAVRLKPDYARGHTALGSALRAKGLVDDAVAAYREGLRLNPDSAGSHSLLVGTLLDDGRLDEASAAAREAVRLHPADPELHKALGVTLEKQGRLADAIAEYEQAARLRPGDGAYVVCVANVLRNQGRHDESLAKAREAIRTSPGLASAHACLGETLAKKGLADEAIAAYGEAVRLRPDVASHRSALGNALAEFGRLDEGLAACREAVRIDAFYAQARNNLAAALGKKGLFEEALAELRESLRLRPGHAATHSDIGSCLFNMGRIDEGIAACREAIRLDPAWANAHRTLGLGLAIKGLLDEAIASFREFLRRSPDDPTGRTDLGHALMLKGRLDEAIAECRESIRLNPRDARVQVLLGDIFRRQKLMADALAAYREALRLGPTDAKSCHSVGIVFMKQGALDDAIAAYRHAIRLKPDLRGVHYDLGNALLEKGLLEDAAASYREEIRLSPDYAEAHCNLASALAPLGQVREARAAIRQGHELGTKRADWRFQSGAFLAELDQRVAALEELEAQLAAYAAAGTEPEGASELVSLAAVALDQKRPALAARWFRAAFEESPDFADALEPGYRRMAARAAVLTSLGGTASAPALDDAARTTWRLQALAWLESELALIKKEADAQRVPPRQVRVALVPLTRTTDLDSVRGADAIAKLPEAERARWTKVWAATDAMLAFLDRKPESR